MRPFIATIAVPLLLLASTPSYAQDASTPVAGGARLGVTVEQMDAIVSGWSAKRSVLNKPVYNDQNQRVGKIEDLIITPENSISFAIVSAGGFLGIGKHDVAVPVEQIKLENNRFILPGATKDALKKMPAFQYAPRK